MLGRAVEWGGVVGDDDGAIGERDAAGVDEGGHGHGRRRRLGGEGGKRTAVMAARGTHGACAVLGGVRGRCPGPGVVAAHAGGPAARGMHRAVDRTHGAVAGALERGCHQQRQHRDERGDAWATSRHEWSDSTAERHPPALDARSRRR